VNVQRKTETIISCEEATMLHV